jgi:diaminopimelate epimerase
MGKAKLIVHSINTGVPHAVIFVGHGTKRGGRRSTSDRSRFGPLLHPLREELGVVDVEGLGRTLRFHPHFKPKGTNVNFVEDVGHNTIAIRTYERGVENETLACGTGMVACALIFHELTDAASPVHVQVRGGETLEVGWEKDGAAYRQVTLTGPADFTFEGEIAL